MAFIRKYLLFPRRFKLAPYLWLLWLLIPLVQMYPYRAVQEKISLALLGIFVIFYRNSWTVTPRLQFWITSQYLLILILTYLEGMLSLFLFTAWVIGSLPLAKKLFNRYLATYYAFLAVGIVILAQKVHFSAAEFWAATDQEGTIIASLVFFLFIILSPLGGRSIRSTYEQSDILKQQNKRYEMLIRQGERDRIARDLHDSLGQSFATITLKTELASKLLSRDPAAARQQLSEIETASRNNLTLVREIVSDLRRVTLTEVLVNLTDKMASLHISLVTHNEELAQEWPVAIQETIAAVLQEAMTNVMQHSQADQVALNFVQVEQTARVEINDNGQGIQAMRPGSHGLRGMKERVQQLQGEFTLTSNHHGTKIELIFPLKKQSDD